MSSLVPAEAYTDVLEAEVVEALGPGARPSW